MTEIVRVIATGNGQQIIVTKPLHVLAQYNAERSRGLVHTPEWREAMAALQAEFDEEPNLGTRRTRLTKEAP